MRKMILLASLTTLSATATPPPQEQQQQEQQQQEQQQQEQQQQQGQCRRNCAPRGYTCHVRMVDCYNRPLYTYWGRGPQYQGACQYAMHLCQRDAAFGYGGYGARCYLLGK